MIVRERPKRAGFVLAAVWLAAAGAFYGAEVPSADDIAALRAQIAAQQQQLEVLQSALASQQKLLDRLASAESHDNRVEVDSLRPGIPLRQASTAIPAGPATVPKTTSDNPCEQGYEGNSVPPYLRLGNVCIQPVGFMDFTAVWRDKNAGSSIGTNFGNIPFNNAAASKLSEIRFSPQNSRVGFRIEGRLRGLHFTGYNEFDFLSSATPGSSGVSNGAVVPRLRLFWVDLRKGKVEVLAGQSWSMLVPNRSGISALPGDLFYSQVVDVNYVAGLTWTREAGFRVLYHPSSKVTMGVSLENPNQYIGGSAGGSGITLPSGPGLAALGGAQLDNTSGGFLSTPNLMPDIIGKVALDPSPRAHLEVAGLVRSFKIWNSGTNTTSTITGGGGALNANVEIVKGLRAISNNFYGSGGGRYLFGQAPDVVATADGSLKTVTSGGFVEGLEYLRKSWLWYAYFGEIYIDRRALLDSNGRTPIGYGYAGAPTSQNRSIQEMTFGFNDTLWRDVRYGAVSLMGQYQYTARYPWSTPINGPKSAHDNAVYINLRYTLPGSIPKI